MSGSGLPRPIDVAAQGDISRHRPPLGQMAPPLPLEFVLSVNDFRNLPDSPSEVAVVGRSNVGKSSLINALSGRQGIARVSKTPGRTRLLNLFTVDGLGTIVDCPGYGYAEASKAMRASWQKMIDSYLLERPQLAMVAVLVDGEIGPTKLDLQLLDWLRECQIPHAVVATKHDKVKSSQRGKRAKELAAACRLDPADVIWVSATKGTGIEKLRGLLHVWLST
jgi:GTP-binding protein